MRRRRFAFATPFVVIVACNKPVTEPVAPDDEARATGAAAQPRSSTPEPRSSTPEPPRSSPPESTPDASMPIDAAVASVDPDRKPTMNPPAPLRLRVVKVEVVGSANVLTLAGGSDNGITKDWAGCMVKSPTNDACSDGGDVAIFRVSPRETAARSTLTYGQITSIPYVKVWPR